MFYGSASKGMIIVRSLARPQLLSQPSRPLSSRNRLSSVATAATSVHFNVCGEGFLLNVFMLIKTTFVTEIQVVS